MSKLMIQLKLHYFQFAVLENYEQNDINFFIPLVGDLPEIEECLYLTTTMECNSFQT